VSTFILFMYAYLRVAYKLSCWVDVGGIEGQNGIWCPIRWKGVTSIFGSSAFFLASYMPLSLHAILV
jgi:hypothetical protein